MIRSAFSGKTFRKGTMTGGALVVLLAAVSASAAPARPDLGWRTFVSEGFPLRFEYPAGLFTEASADVAAATAGATQRTGRVFSTGDGRASLQVGAFENADRLSAAELRGRALKTTYDGASVEYDRLAQTWFVLSGRREDVMYYERVSLTCGGQRIDVWTMSYPVEERAMFDSVVEEMAQRYRQSLRQVRCR